MHRVNNDRPSRLRPQVILLGVAALLNDISSDMIYPLLPIFMTTYVGASPLILGLVEGIAEGVSSILKMIVGQLSDRYPRRKPFIVGGYFVAAMARVLVASAVRWPTVLAGRLLDKTGKGLRSAPRDAMICDVTPLESRGRAFGFHRALDHTGAVLGPLLAFALLTGLGMSLRNIFFLAVIPGLAAALLLLFTLREPKRPAANTRDITVVSKRLPRPFWIAMSSIGLFSLANSSDVFLILQAHRAGVAVAMIPLVWAAHHLVKALLSTHGGALSDRWNRKTVLMLGWILYGVVYLLFPLPRTVGGFLLLFLLYAVPFALSEGAEKAWAADLVSAEQRGRAFGVFYLITGLLTLTGTALFGWLYQVAGAKPAFYTGATLAFVAAGTLLVQQEKARRES